MIDPEIRIREAFDQVTMPSELKAKTLHYIKENQSAATSSVEIDQSQVLLPQNSSSALPMQSSKEAPMTRQSDSATRSSRQGAATRKQANPLARRFGFAFAACLLLCVLGFGGFKAYTTKTALVGIDVNPSVELGVNMFDIVVSAVPLNDDGQQVLSQVDLVGKGYSDAMDTLFQSTAFLSYIDSESFVAVNIVCDGERQSSVLTVESDVKLATLPCGFACGQATEEEYYAAQEAGMGVGRYMAAIELIRLDPSMTLEECRNMTMRELRSRIAALDPDNAYALSPSGGGQGMGNGSGQGKGQGRAFGNGQGAGAGQGKRLKL